MEIDIEKRIREIVEQKAEKIKTVLKLVEDRKNVNKKIAELQAKATEIDNKIKSLVSEDIIELLPNEAKESVNEIVKSKRQSATGGRKRYGKTIVFLGQEYRNMQYFMNRHGIRGGVNGIIQWATSQGYEVMEDSEKIIITTK